MKRYVYAMSMSRDRAKQQIGAYSPAIMEHLIKLMIYSDIRQNDISGWISTIASRLYNAGKITVKPDSKKLKEDDIVDSLFGCMGNSDEDYYGALLAFKDNNRYGKFNYLDKTSYPDFDVTEELAEDLMTICFDLMNKVIPLLTDKSEHNKEEYELIIRDIFSRLQ